MGEKGSASASLKRIGKTDDVAAYSGEGEFRPETQNSYRPAARRPVATPFKITHPLPDAPLRVRKPVRHLA